jgi:antitoxin (DNA-binding transcriptional repressor) of toxin-antitoxin stability system
MQQFKIEEAQTRLAELFNEAIKGKEVFIRKDREQMVQLVPVDLPPRHPQFGSASGLVELADDFDATLNDFDEYMP